FSGDLVKSVQRLAEILARGVFFFSKQWRRQRCFIDPFGAVVLRRVQKAIRGALYFSITEKSNKAQRRRRRDSGGEELQRLGRCSAKFFGSSDGDDLRGGKREVDRRKQRRPAITGEKRERFLRESPVSVKVPIVGAVFKDGGLFGEIRRRSFRWTRRRPAR
ncbi:hypothetical protein U1Q18_007211, partial [Sarracenia purpurea var. burkii]